MIGIGIGFKFDYLYGRGYYQDNSASLFDYTLYGKIGYLLPQFNIQTLDTDFTDSVEMLLLIRADRTEAFTKELTEMSAGKVVPEFVEERFCEME